MEISVQSTKRTELIDITNQVKKMIQTSGMVDGLCMVYVPHTTAAVTINENADPDVRLDIETVLDRLIPWEDGYHHLEGNSAAHVKSSLMGASEWLAVKNGKPVLGTWQGIYFCEFDGPRKRNLHCNLLPSQTT